MIADVRPVLPPVGNPFWLGLKRTLRPESNMTCKFIERDWSADATVCPSGPLNARDLRIGGAQVRTFVSRETTPDRPMPFGSKAMSFTRETRTVCALEQLIFAVTLPAECEAESSSGVMICAMSCRLPPKAYIDVATCPQCLLLRDDLNGGLHAYAL